MTTSRASPTGKNLQRTERGSNRAVDMKRRIFGLENEYGITCTLHGRRRLSPDEVARILFREVVTWGRSSNVFLENGARLYLDVGSHPEYATPECTDLHDLVAHDKAGERIIEDLQRSAEIRLHKEGIKGNIFLYKNNTDSAGNSYGCHENYLVRRKVDFQNMLDILIPFLVSRQIFTGAGKLQQTSKGTKYSISQRANHIWEGVSSATTRSRPIINTRDEPHADAEQYRRLHVIAGDSNMNEYATFVKVGVTAALLEMIESGVIFRDRTLANPIRAIREISSDPTCKRLVELANGRRLSALDIQWEYWEQTTKYAGFSAPIQQAVDLWGELLTGLEKDPLGLDRRVDWVTKHHLIERYRAKHGLALSDAKVQLLDLSYHDVTKTRSLYYLLLSRGVVDRLVPEVDVAKAKKNPPQTRALLRGRFIAAAKAKNRDYQADWVHLKLNDQAQRTVICKDPFKYEDDRVEQLIAGL